MASTNIEFRVGVIILMGLLILFGSLYWLQGYKLERNSQLVRVRFDDVGTLAVGDMVTVSGVHRGKVNRLTLTEGGVNVELLIYRDVILKRDAQFAIKNMGVMGERFIAVSPGKDSLPFDPAQVPEGLYDTGLPEVMGLLGEMITELRNLVVSFKRTVGSDSSLKKFNNTVDNLQQVSSSLADYLSRNENKLDETADNFFRVSKELRRVITENSRAVDSSVQRIDRATSNLERFIGQLDSLSASAREFANALNNPDGTAQLLLQDRRLYDDLRRTADNIDDLINDIRANPRKYINLTVELF